MYMKNSLRLFISLLIAPTLCMAQIGGHSSKKDSAFSKKNTIPYAVENAGGASAYGVSGVYSYSISTTNYNILCTYINSGPNAIPANQFACKNFPVKLISFNGDYDNETNIASLNWATSCETASRFFIIMRSNNGNDWKTIDTLLAAGNSEKTSHYSFSDMYPPQGTIYYKLVQEDNQGNQKTFSPITINVISANIIKAYPSLMGHLVYMQGDIQNVKVTNSQGVKVTDSMDDANGEPISFVNVSMLRNGLYLIQATNNAGNVLTLKIAKQ
jgi:hypothetical protein